MSYGLHAALWLGLFIGLGLIARYLINRGERQ